MPHVIRNENPKYYDPESTLVMVSKGLFAALDNNLPHDDRKSALEVPIIEAFMRLPCVELGGVHTQSERSRCYDKVQRSTFGATVFPVAHWNVHDER